MPVDDSMMPLSEGVKTPQVYKMETKDSSYDKEKNGMKILEPQKMIGLTKEQLEQYRNDPFWKIVRYVMFALFWMAWILMFAGAIVLVVVSPKCVLKKEPEWWRKQISYQVFTPSFRDSNNDGIGDFTGIREKLNDLRKTGVQTLWVTPVVTTQKDDFVPLDVTDFMSADERFGTMNDLKELVDEAHRLDMRFTMDFPISSTSASHKWFKSVQAGGEYRDYYIWKKASDISEEDSNYIVEKGKDFAYLAYDGKYPVLNWGNAAVRDSIFKAAKIYLDLGIDGFHIAYINQITKYQPALHGRTALSMIGEFIESIREYVNKNETLNAREIAVFSTLDDLAEMHDLEPSEYSLSNLTYVLDNSVTKINNESCVDGISKCLYSTLITSLERFENNQLPYAWQFSDYHVSRLSTRFDKSTADLLTLVQLSLPGAVELYYGQELSLQDTTDSTSKFTGLMQWDSSDYAGFTAAKEKPFLSTTPDHKDNNFQAQLNAIRSSLKTFKTVAKLRQRDDNFALGEILMDRLTVQGVILFSRSYRVNNVTKGAYVIAANFGTTGAEVNGTAVVHNDRRSAPAEVVALTPNVDNYSLRKKIALQDEKIFLNPKAGIIFKI